MTAIQPVIAKPTHEERRAARLKRRLERYAAMGPNCPNGHPWEKHAKYNKGYYRYCTAARARSGWLTPRPTQVRVRTGIR
jgi:hypothetical protein